MKITTGLWQHLPSRRIQAMMDLKGSFWVWQAAGPPLGLPTEALPLLWSQLGPSWNLISCLWSSRNVSLLRNTKPQHSYGDKGKCLCAPLFSLGINNTETTPIPQNNYTNSRTIKVCRIFQKQNIEFVCWKHNGDCTEKEQVGWSSSYSTYTLPAITLHWSLSLLSGVTQVPASQF